MKFAGIVISVCIVLLVGLGVVAIASVSDVASAAQYRGDAHRMLRMQLLFAAAGFAIAVAAARTPPSFWFRREVVAAAALLALAGLAVVHVPGLAEPHKGSWRWVALGPVRGQPSEFVKLAAILVTAWWVGDPALDKRRFVRSALVPAAWLGVLVLGLIQTLIVFDGRINSWWTRIIVGLLVLAFIFMQNLITKISKSKTKSH